MTALDVAYEHGYLKIQHQSRKCQYKVLAIAQQWLLTEITAAARTDPGSVCTITAMIAETLDFLFHRTHKPAKQQ